MFRFSLLLIFTTQALGTPEVQLPNGLIRGYESTTFGNTSYYAFEKIPYAAPPVRELRFKAPVPPQDWNEPLDTLDLDVTCYQQTSETRRESENCLYLNVFTPQLPDDDNISLPVMLFIHGGGFRIGSARDYQADRIIDENIVYVAINYRLGPLGFLSTEDEIIPGNNGLKDQQMAIKWTHDNIHLFGGDPERITIIGQSAGSASCSYHLLNQNSRDLFQSVIQMSGSSLSPWAFQRHPKEIAFATAAFLNDTFQTNRNSQDLLEFLQSVSANEIDDASYKYYESVGITEREEILQEFRWAPVIEVRNPDAFLTKKMYGLIKAQNVVPVPLLIGINSEEYISWCQGTTSFSALVANFDANLSMLVPDDMGVDDQTNRTELGSKIRDMYTEGEPFSTKLGAAVRYGSDTAFTRPIIKQAELHSKIAETYFYQISYDGKLGHQKTQYDGAEHVGHSQQKPYIFCSGSDCDLSSYPEMDKITSDRLIKLWTNFAKYQNPTPEPSELLQNITWPSVSTDDGDFMYLDIDENLEIKNHPKEDTYEKWVGLYDEWGTADFDTY